MWKKLCAAVAGLSLATGCAEANDPAFPNTGVFAVEQPGGQQPPPPNSRVLPALRWTRPTNGGLSSLEEEGFRGSVFNTRSYPSSGRGIMQTGGLEGKLTTLPDTAPQSTLLTPAKTDGLPAGAITLADGSLLIPKSTTPEGETIYEAVPASQVANPTPGRTNWRVWGSAEALLGMTRRANVPPVVTTGPAALGLGNAAAIGQPGTVPLFGGRGMLDDWRAGMRAELGAWFDDSHNWGVSARYYSLFSTSDQLRGGSDGSSVVNLPQFIPLGPSTLQFPAYVGFPGVTHGSVSTTTQTSFSGGDINLRHTMSQSANLRIEGLFGYRQLHIGDELAAGFTVVSGQVPVPFNPSLIGSDNIRSRNNFYGGNIGGVATYTWRWLTIEGLTAVALGVNVSDVDFERSRQATVGFVTPVPLVSTSSTDRNTYFGVAAESGVKVGVFVTSHAKLTFGYTGLYWNNLRRAQDQYTLGPTLTGNTTYMYAHMFSWGAEFRY